METLNELGAALAAAQAEMSNPTKNTKNSFLNSSYADLAECTKVAHESLAAHGIGVIQAVHGDRLRTTLLHKSGQMIADDGIPLMGFETAKNSMQAFGSAVTYARRYGLCAMVGLAQADDDGNSAGKRKKPSAKDLDKIFPGSEQNDAPGSSESNAKAPPDPELPDDGDAPVEPLKLAYEDSHQFYKEYLDELTKIFNDEGIGPRDRMSALKAFEQTNEDGLASIPVVGREALEDKRKKYNKALGAKK